MQQYYNLVFEGGGVKGIAYVGALRALNEQYSQENVTCLSKVIRVAGTSAGAITALLVGLNYTVDEIETELDSLDFSIFEDKATWAQRFIDFLHGNWYQHPGEEILHWIRKKITQKIKLEDPEQIITFSDLKKYGCKDMYFVATNLSCQKEQIFSIEHTPDMPVDLAVRASIAIPFFFRGVRFSIEQNGHYNPCGQDVFVDGGILHNYPIEVFDDLKYIVGSDYQQAEQARIENSYTSSDCFNNHETIGFKVDSAAEINSFLRLIDLHTEIHGEYEYIKALSTLYWGSEDIRRGVTENNRTIYIDSGNISTTQFNLSIQDKRMLVDSGYMATTRFIIKVQESETRERQFMPLLSAHQLPEVEIKSKYIRGYISRITKLLLKNNFPLNIKAIHEAISAEDLLNSLLANILQNDDVRQFFRQQEEMQQLIQEILELQELLNTDLHIIEPILLEFRKLLLDLNHIECKQQTASTYYDDDEELSLAIRLSLSP